MLPSKDKSFSTLSPYYDLFLKKKKKNCVKYLLSVRKWSRYSTCYLMLLKILQIHHYYPYLVCCVLFQSLSCVQPFVTTWTRAHQAPLAMGFSRQEYWSELPWPPPGTFSTQGSHPGLLHCRQILHLVYAEKI